MKFIATLLFLMIPSICFSGNLLPISTTYIPSDSLGSNLITPAANSEFSSDTGFWTKTGTASIHDGVGTLSGASSIEKGSLLDLGVIYRTIYTTKAVRGGSVRIQLGGTAGTTRTTTGTFTQDLLSTGLTCYFVGVAGSDVDIDDVTIAKLSYVIGTKSYYSTTFRQNLPGTLSGDTAGVWSIISGPDINGKAYQIANTGSTDVVVTLTPTKALTVGRHYRPIVIAKRTVGSGTPTFKLTGGGAVSITSATFVPLTAPAKATNTTDKPTFTVPAGCTIQFYQPKLLTVDSYLIKKFNNFNSIQ